MTLMLSCRCGGARLVATGTPLSCAYCHCASCREFQGGAVSAAATWRASDLAAASGSRPIGEFKHPMLQMSRHFCPACGDTLFVVNRLGLRAVSMALLRHAHRGSLPARYTPTMHLNYAQREVDVIDDLPKYLERPGGPQYHDRRALAGAPAAERMATVAGGFGR
jgi:hypothetical protein